MKKEYLLDPSALEQFDAVALRHLIGWIDPFKEFTGNFLSGSNLRNYRFDRCHLLIAVGVIGVEGGVGEEGGVSDGG